MNNKSQSKRPIGLIILAAVIGVGLAIYSTTQLYKSTGKTGLRGTIIEKNFTPQPETQISIGGDGLQKTTLKGEYTFLVRIESSGREYIIYVNEQFYNAYKVGDTYHFVKPPPEENATLNEAGDPLPEADATPAAARPAAATPEASPEAAPESSPEATPEATTEA